MTFLECCEITASQSGAKPVLALRRTTLLPSIEAPEMVIFQADDLRWRVADAHGVRTLEEGAEIRLQGRAWRLRGAVPPLLRFRVSQDEEHVRLELRRGDTCIDLGERCHHQSLLLLARERRTDERRGVTPVECGWLDVESMVRMLRLDTQHLNIHVFRARRQVEPALRQLGLAIELVERRSGQMRFGPVTFEIEVARPW